MKLLEEVGKLLQEKAYFIENIDVTVIAQRPKLAPYIPEMKKILQEFLASGRQVNVRQRQKRDLDLPGRSWYFSFTVCLLSEIQNYVGADVLMEDRGCAGCGGCARFGGIQK